MLQDKILLWRIRKGDRFSLSQLYKNYKDDLLTVAFLLLNDVAAAENILRDIFIAFVGDINKVPTCRLRFYLISNILECVRNRAKTKMYQMVEVDRTAKTQTGSHEPFQQITENAKLLRLAETLQRIPIYQREVIVLHLHGQLRFRDIAKLQNISTSTAKGRYSYGIDQLSSVLDEEALA